MLATNSEKIVRKIIKIDEELCTGCGNCIIGCPEQAIELVDTPHGKKARIVKDLYCDGLGACIGSCPADALTIEERATEPYDDDATIERIKEVAPEMLAPHIKHMEEHGMATSGNHHTATPPTFSGCPGSRTLQWDEQEEVSKQAVKIKSELRQWPIQLHLVSPSAPYFKHADLAFIADCVGFAYPNFHQEILKDKAITVFCPKLDDTSTYLPKIAQIIKTADPKSITVYHMTVPCCFGLTQIVSEAAKQAKSDLKIKEVVIGIKGEKNMVSPSE